MDKEYISREEAIEATRSAVVYKAIADLVEHAIFSIPAADVREVVTCGECKHWFENGTYLCSCDRDALLRERDFFCAAWEKREEET